MNELNAEEKIAQLIEEKLDKQGIKFSTRTANEPLFWGP